MVAGGNGKEPIVQIEEVTKSFGDQKVLCGVTGNLSLADDGHINRTLRCAEFRQGLPALLEPDTQDTPAWRIARIAETLSPMSRIVSGKGPMNTNPLSTTRSAKSAFSERNP